MNSEALFDRAKRVIPGGVNSPVRAFNAVGGDPVYVADGCGARITTVEDRELIDFCGSWGALLFGHARDEIVSAISAAAAKGTSFGINTPAEVEFAERLCEAIPYVDMVRLVSSGTEAVMTAIRLARGVTGRNKILKFDGGYHGHSDCLLVAAGSGVLTAGGSSSAGVPPGVVADSLVAPYNDLDAVRQAVSTYGDDLAAIIIEPVAGNMGLVPAETVFLRGLRDLTSECGALLIFDEVISGFRLAPTTYGAISGVTPDITTLGKIIGGGMPIGAIAGKESVMSALAPTGDVYQAGTLSGNPVAVAAGLATLDLVESENPYSSIAQLGEKLREGLDSIGKEMHCSCLGGMFTPFFGVEPVRNLDDAKRCDAEAYAAFFTGMLARGIYLPPSQYEVAFISAAHTEAQIGACLDAARATLATSGPTPT